FEDDTRLPHFADKITRQIHKTALGAESSVPFSCHEDLEELLAELSDDYTLVALEQAPGSLSPEACAAAIAQQATNKPVALIVGNEIHGVSEQVLKRVDYTMEIPMAGAKESLNVSVATAIALYVLTRS